MEKKKKEAGGTTFETSEKRQRGRKIKRKGREESKKEMKAG